MSKREFNMEIVVNLQYEATHNWPNCDIPEVAYLKHPHRHLFHIKCKAEVNHSDRDLEIIMFKRGVLQHLEEKYAGSFGSQSCEMIALELFILFELTECQVLEDGENGAIVTLKNN